MNWMRNFVFTRTFLTFISPVPSKSIGTGYCKMIGKGPNYLLSSYFFQPPTSLSLTEYTQSGNGHFLAFVHFIMVEKLSQASEGGGGCTPSPFRIIYHHVQVVGQIHSPYFYSIPICTLWYLIFTFKIPTPPTPITLIYSLLTSPACHSPDVLQSVDVCQCPLL